MIASDKPNYVLHCFLCGWPEGQPWLTVKQASASLSVPRRKVRQMIHMGAFNQVLKIDNEWRIHHDALDAYIAETQEVVGVSEKKSRGK